MLKEIIFGESTNYGNSSKKIEIKFCPNCGEKLV